jgi:DNA-binding PadR family transcriptional regulator
MQEEEEKLRGRILDSISKGDNYEYRISTELNEESSSVYQALKALENNRLIKGKRDISQGPASNRRQIVKYSLTSDGVKAVEIREYIRKHSPTFPELFLRFSDAICLINLMVAIGIIRRQMDGKAKLYTEWEAHKILCSCGRYMVLGKGSTGTKCESCGRIHIRECYGGHIAVST